MDGSPGRSARVGFLIFLATLVTMAGVYLIGGRGGFLLETSKYRILFPSTSGLRPEARVYVNGVLAGKVESIGFPPSSVENQILVTISVEAEIASRLNEGSTASIQNEGLLGDKKVDVHLGKSGATALPAGAEIPVFQRSFVDEMLSGGESQAGTTSDLLQNIIVLLKQVNQGQGTVGKLLRDPMLYDEMARLTQSLAKATDELAVVTHEMKDIITQVKEQKGTLGKLIFSDEYNREFTRAVQGANRLIDSLLAAVAPLSTADGGLGRLLLDEKLRTDIGVLVSRGVDALSNVNLSLLAAREGRSAVARLLHDEAFGDRLEKAVANVEAILAKVNDGPGLAAALVNDPSLAQSFRDIALGVQDSNLVLSVARNAEAKGRTKSLIERQRLLARQREEAERSRKKASGEADGSGTPQPAASKANQSTPIPVTGPDPSKGSPQDRR